MIQDVGLLSVCVSHMCQLFFLVFLPFLPLFTFFFFFNFYNDFQLVCVLSRQQSFPHHVNWKYLAFLKDRGFCLPAPCSFSHKERGVRGHNSSCSQGRESSKCPEFAHAEDSSCQFWILESASSLSCCLSERSSGEGGCRQQLLSQILYVWEVSQATAGISACLLHLLDFECQVLAAIIIILTFCHPRFLSLHWISEWTTWNWVQYPHH